MRRYKIPQEVSTEIKLTKHIYISDLLVIMGMFFLKAITGSLVHSNLNLLYTVFLVVVGVILIIRPRHNPQKKMYDALLFSVLRKRHVYTPIPFDEKEIEQWQKTRKMK